MMPTRTARRARLIAAALIAVGLAMAVATGCADGDGASTGQKTLQPDGGYERFVDDAWGISFDYPRSFKRQSEATAKLSAGSLPAGSMAVSFSPDQAAEGAVGSTQLLVFAIPQSKTRSRAECQRVVDSMVDLLRERVGQEYEGGPWILDGAAGVTIGGSPAARVLLKADADDRTDRTVMFLILRPSLQVSMVITAPDGEYQLYEDQGVIAHVHESVRFQ